MIQDRKSDLIIFFVIICEESSDLVLPEKPTLDEMWRFIDNIMRPNKLVPDRSTLSYEEVFSVYSKLCEIDVMFRDIEQIKIFKKN